MTNVGKKDGGQARGNEPQQRGELVRRAPFQELVRDPFQMFGRDPFRWMREMMMEPWRMFQMAPWGQVAPEVAAREVTWNVGFDVRETDDAFIIEGDLPGLSDKELDISLAGNLLQITGKREHEERREEGRFHAYERSYGSFARSFTLPEAADLDKVRCDLKNGVLTVVVPKKPGASPQRRKIQVGSGARA